MAIMAGADPATFRLTTGCSAVELHDRSASGWCRPNYTRKPRRCGGPAEEHGSKMEDHHGNDPCSQRLRGVRISFMLVVRGGWRRLRSGCGGVKSTLQDHPALRSPSYKLVVPSGIEPESDAYQAPALPLSYRTMVCLRRIERRTFAMSRRCSPTELKTRFGRR